MILDGSKVSSISQYMGGSLWEIDNRGSKGVMAYFDVSDFSSIAYIGQPVVLIPDATYRVKAIPVPAGAVSTQTAIIGVALGYGEGQVPNLMSSKTDITADGVYAVQTHGEVKEARVTEEAAFVAGNYLELIINGTSFIKSGASSAVDDEVCGIASEACSAGTDIVLHKIILGLDNTHTIQGS